MTELPTRFLRTWLKEPRVIIHVDGAGAARDLMVLGFVSEEESAQVGMVVVEALREAFPDHAITGVTFESNRAQLESDNKAQADIWRAEREAAEREAGYLVTGRTGTAWTP